MSLPENYYAAITRNDPNPVKRYLQRRRFELGFEALKDLSPGSEAEILDFGGADGELCRILAGRYPGARLTCYEPAPDLASDAERNLREVRNARVVSDVSSLTEARYDYILCLEVLEHLPERETHALLADAGRLLRPGGRLIVGVPNEIHLAALCRGAFRIARRYGAYDARLGNIFRAAGGRPPKDRPKGEIAPGLHYHFHHLGFDYRALKQRLQRSFTIDRVYGSPAPGLPLLFNFEVYFVCSPRAAEPGLRRAA